MPDCMQSIAAKCGLLDDELLLYGQNKAKVSLKALERLKDRPLGKLICVTAITPTPAGEGKTVTTIGLGDGLRRIGERAAVCIREPSLGPVFGVKGGGAGGGRAQAFPSDELNLHFTGDSHAIAAAHNLLAALIEAHVYHGNEAGFDPHGIWWNRVLDVTDRALRHVVVGLGGKPNGRPRESSFDITAASEIMALMQLCTGIPDLRERLARIVVGVSQDGRPITAGALNAGGALAVLLRDAVMPNLIQTLEGTPLFAHTGPFGNIATGCSSVVADRLALRVADYVVTEGGFGSDLGFEKFCHIVAPTLGKAPDAAVIVATVRGIKAHSGKFKLAPGKPMPPELEQEDLEALHAGATNLAAHIGIVRRFGVPAVVAINRFPSDTDRELEELKTIACQLGARQVAVSDGFARGSVGTAEMAEAVRSTCEHAQTEFRPVYRAEDRLTAKIEAIATQVYGAADVYYEAGVRTKLRHMEKWGYGHLPICVAKTQYSISHDAGLKGAPSGFTVPIMDVQLAAGAGFVRVLCGDIMTMPGLSAHPAAFRMELDDEGTIHGVM